MLEIWGRKNSSNVIPVMWTMGELGLECVRHNVGGSFGGTDTEEYRAMNPNKLVPTMNDNGLILFESNAIVRHLASNYGRGSLWPDDPEIRARADQWMGWTKSTLNAQFFPIFWGLIRKAAEDRDLEQIDNCIKATAKTLEIVERNLENQDFMAGDSLTIGDVPLGTLAFHYFNLDIDRVSLPNFEAWYERLCGRVAYQTHAMIPIGNGRKTGCGSRKPKLVTRTFNF